MSLTQSDKDDFIDLIKRTMMETTNLRDERWQKNARNLGDVTTGEDLSTTNGKANVRAAYEYVKGQMNRSNLIVKTVVVELVKIAVVTAIVIIWIKLK